MVTCGHQFHMGDDCDWLISSSAMCPVNGNSSATKILKQLIETHCATRTSEPQTGFDEICENKNDSEKLDVSDHSKSDSVPEGPTKMQELMLEAREMPLAMPNPRKSKTRGRNETDYAIPVCYDSDEFDENQHLDGCPIKWYYRKRTKDGWGPCVALCRRTEERHKGAAQKRFRDRIPLEVKIGKINLNRREPFTEFRNVNPTKKRDEPGDGEKYKKFEIDPKVAEIQKKRLEAKLNWRPFQESEDQTESELSYDRSSSDGYLRPRPALGGKYPVSIVLFPYHHQNYSCGNSNHKQVPKIRVQRVSSAGQNMKHSNSSKTTQKSKNSRPKTTQSLRWGQRMGKRLQLPKQMNVLFNEPTKRQATDSGNSQGSRKLNEKGKVSRRNNEDNMKNSQSLTSLYYELEDKSNSGKIIDDEYLERMIRELSMEDNLRSIRNILKPGFSVKKKILKDEYPLTQWSNDDHFKVICKQVKFCKRGNNVRTLSEAEDPVIIRNIKGDK